ncbi:MAG: PD-(D/E)XK nuclease family protein [Balneolales bacterium]
MTGLALHHNPAELYRFLVNRVKHEPEKKLILVRSQATKRFLTRELQKELNFFAPKIETLESWLDELSALSLNGNDRPGLILSPDERVLVLEDWLSNHTIKAYRRFAGSQSVQAISNIIADLRRANIPLDRLSSEINEKNFSGTPHFAALLKDYQAYLIQTNREDRERLPALLNKLQPELIPQDELILYELNYLFAGQKQGWEAVMNFCNTTTDKAISVIQFIPKSADPEDISMQLIAWFKKKAVTIEFLMQKPNGASTVSSLLANRARERPLYIQDWHDPRTELDQTMRQICRGIDMAKPGEHGSKCSDYVILAGDINRYESMAETLARQYSLPVYCSRGPSLISHPVMRRLLKLLQLIPQGFQIDDVYQIFADNQIRLPRLDHHVDSTPNIRSFSQFCRHYNLRTLREAEEQLISIFEIEKNYSINRAEEQESFDLQRSLEKQEANLLFYQNVINHLRAFRDKYATKGIHPLDYWITHARTLLSMPENLFSSEANVIRSKMLETLDDISETHTRLGLTPELDHSAFMDILELTIEKQREKSEERPEGILLTQAGYFSDTFGKTVFLLGMNEGGFPSVAKMDYLQFRYQEKLSGMLYQARPDPYLEARLELTRQLAGAEHLFISRPEHISQNKVIGSSLWQDLLLELQQNEGDYSTWLKEPKDLVICQADLEKHKALQTNVATDILFKKINPAHSELIASITNERENTQVMGYYDGMLAVDVKPEWQATVTKQIEILWSKHAPNNTIQTSISRLDEYAGSPLDYFFNRVLRLSPPELYKDEAESDIKGTLLHEVLEAFYTPETPYAKKYTELVWPKDDMDQAQHRMNEITEALLHEYRNQLGYKDSPFPTILKNNIKRAAGWFLEQETELHKHMTEYLDDLRPATLYHHPHFKMEYRWELTRDYGDIKANLIGKIDRIDVDKSSNSAVLYDYKSGSYGLNSFSKTINWGQSFQLPIYGLAILDKNIKNFAAGYYSLPMGKSKSDVTIKYEMGDKSIFKESFVKNTATYRGIMNDAEILYFLQKIEALRLEWILRSIKRGVFNTSLIGQPKYSPFKWISRYDHTIQKERGNLEEQKRNNSPNPHHMLRYYAPLEIFTED